MLKIAFILFIITLSNLYSDDRSYDHFIIDSTLAIDSIPVTSSPDNFLVTETSDSIVKAYSYSSLDSGMINWSGITNRLPYFASSDSLASARIGYRTGLFMMSLATIYIPKTATRTHGLQIWGQYDTASYLFLGMNAYDEEDYSAFLKLDSEEDYNGDFQLETGVSGQGTIYANTFLSIGATDSIRLEDKTVVEDTFYVDSVFDIRNAPIAIGPDTFFVKDNGSDRVKVFPVDSLMDGYSDTAHAHEHGVTTNYIGKATGATTWGSSLVYDNGSNVGIGTTSPLTRLEVKAASGDTGIITVTGNFTVSEVGEENCSIQFRSGDGSILSTNDIAGKIASVNEYANGAWAGMSFWTADNSVPPYLNERMRITHVGIVELYYGLNLDYSTANRLLMTDDSKNAVASDYIDSTESGSPWNKHLMTPPYLYIEPNTVDGNDTGMVYIGGIGSTRGGKIAVYGNEHTSSPGDVDVICGSDGSVSIGDTTTIHGGVRITGNLNVDDSVGIATEVPLGRLDVAGGRITLFLGADPNLTTRTDDTQKYTRIGTAQYDNEEEGVAAITAFNFDTSNVLNMGGGTTYLNGATTLNFYTAADISTTVGTIRATIDSLGTMTLFYGLNLDYSTANRLLMTDDSKNAVASDYIDSTETGSPWNKHLMTPPYLYIETNTVDANDTGFIHIGGIGSTRGGKVAVYGNEHTSSPGKVDIQCGDDGFNSIGDTTVFFGDVVLDDRDASRPIGTNANKKIIHADSFYTVACSLFDGATYRATASSYIYTIGKAVHVKIPELSGTITASTTTYLRFGFTFTAPPGTPAYKPLFLDLAGAPVSIGAIFYSGTYGFTVVSETHGYLPAGSQTITENSLVYFTQ